MELPDCVLCVVLSCAADAEGRNFRGVTDPLISAVISSPLEEGPADAKYEPFWDLLSVEAVPWLPLRFRFRYFSIASASLSRMRFATGDNAETGFDGGPKVLFDVVAIGKVAALLVEPVFAV